MIYTVTLNPSVDYIVQTEHFTEGELHRTTNEAKFPGGKGINVSRVLKRLGVESKATGFIGGFTGAYIKDSLKQEQIQTAFIEVQEDTRINIKLKTAVETEINGQGPTVDDVSFQKLVDQIHQMKNDDILVLAGSIPSSLPQDVYQHLLQLANEQGASVVVDTSGKALLNLVQHRPFLIKPNHHELGELFDVDIHDVDTAVFYGKKLVEQGAQHVIVSMAGDGALLVTESAVCLATVPKGEVKNSVGAGDSLVAGFLASYVQSRDIAEAFQIGVATGSATAFSLELCTKEEVDMLRPQIMMNNLG
ncbi:1-phosphofructokinase [Metabacillus iocasae]|uniref:Tagatose-6-phosphate kinase n=1 Tax=Priestia iocasae TaxID=2291674 RepID=A0ABS2QSH7_9BACI|nr:1-phosphofructokinase [Metabacillus iocasae]